MQLGTKSRLSLLFLFFLAVYFVSSLPVVFKDTFHHYVYLADALSRGRLNLRLPVRGEHDYRDSFDDIAVYDNRFYLALPPAPALVLVPFLGLGGVHLNARLATVFIGAVGAGLCWLLLKKEEPDERSRLRLTLLFGLGTVYWFVAAHGGSWYMAQVCAVTFLLGSLLAAQRGRGLAGGLLLAGAFLCRQLTLLALPAVLATLGESPRGRNTRQRLLAVLGTTAGIFLYLLYNHLRFGNPLETGYAHHLIRGEAVIQFQRYGLFHSHYLVRNLYTLLLMPPKFLGRFPFIYPRPEGMALIFTSPALFYALSAPFRDRGTAALGLSVFLILGAQLFYCNNGAWQFGYRFILDALPLLIILTSRGMRRARAGPAGFLIAYSVAANLYGVVLLRNLL